MAQKTRPTLKTYFEAGDRPTQGQYAHLIDSSLNLAETGVQAVTGSLIVSQSILVESHITASGNISASGTIYANDFKSSGGDVSGVNFHDNLNITGSLTASGNISASGTIVANKIESDQLVSRTGDPNTGLQFASDTVTIEGNNVNIAHFASTYIDLNKPVTASSDVSASGNIYADRYFVDGEQFANVNLSAVQLSNPTTYTTITGSRIHLGNPGDTNLHVTASGNISASGTITGKTGSFDFFSGTSTGLTGTPDITVGIITASKINADSINTTALTIEGAIYGQSTSSFWASGSSGKIYYNGGNVGIGTTAPEQALTVKSGYVAVTGSGTSGYGYELARAGKDTYRMQHLDGGLTIVNVTDTNRKEMTFKGDGSVGIGNASPPEALTVSGSISASGDILLDEDQRIYFEADKGTWIESNAADMIRVVVGGSQMFQLDYDTGNRATFGNGTKVYIGNNNNALPSETLQVDGNISSSGAIHTLSHITASGNISASDGHIEGRYYNARTVATGYRLGGSNILYFKDNYYTFGRQDADVLISGSAINLGKPGETNTNVTASGNISASGTIYAADSVIYNNSSVIGNITASGNITCSGFISASAIYADTIYTSGSTLYVGNEAFSETHLSDMKAGKPVALDSAVGGFNSIVRPQAIMSALNTNDYQKWTIAGRIGTFLGGALIHDMKSDDDSSYISMGKSDATTKIGITGSLEISGSSTLTNWGNFRNRLHRDHKAFEVSTNPYAAGGFREGMTVPTPAHTGSAPHLHFMLSGSGQAGVGLLNPEHTLHVSASSGDFNALQVEGDAVINGCLTANAIGNPSTISSNTTVPAGYNVQLLTSFTNPSITIAAGVNYTVSAGADVAIT
tara:strand:- start:329 stop:2911 length:2583 start_codon:yes stop_codon:yes gene_type:complete